MKIQMLYRAYELLGDGTEYEMLAPKLFIRAEEIEIDGDDLSDGLKHVKARDGERFINCVPA